MDKNRALRSALIDISGAMAGLKKALAALRKAQKSCKGFPEADDIGSYVDSVQKTLGSLQSDAQSWNDEADQLRIDQLIKEGRWSE